CTRRFSGRRRDGPGPGAVRHPARRPRRRGALLPHRLEVRPPLAVGPYGPAASGSGARRPLHLPRHQRRPPPRERTDHMKTRRASRYVTVTTDVEVDIADYLTESDDAELEELGLHRADSCAGDPHGAAGELH